MAGRPAKQRLVELNVGEVSLVDQPANEEPFLVVKSEEGAMGTQADPKAAAAADAQKPATEAKPEAAAAAEDDDAVLLAEVEKASLTLVAAMEKAKKAKPPFPPKPAAAEGEDEEDDEEEMKGKKRKRSALRKGIHSLMEHIKGLMDQYGSETEDKQARKSVDAEADESGLNIQIGQDGKIVLKGKAFGNQRIAKLKDALAPLLELLKEVDPEGFGALTSGSMKPPGPELPGNTSHSMPSAVNKSMEDKMDKLLDAVTAVSKRIEAVEKSQAVTKSLPEGGTADPKQVKKGDSIWTGVI